MVQRGVVPRAAEVVGRFFAAQAEGAAGGRLDRVRRMKEDLVLFVEEHASLVLAPHEIALIALERQFGAEQAACRVAEAPAVLLLLPLFLEESQWHGLGLLDRRVRLELAGPLAHTIAALPELADDDLGPAVWIVEATVRHGVWMLRQEREATRRH